MAALLLVLAVLGLVVLGDAIVENTASTDLTLFGQRFEGFTLGGWLALAAALGALATCLLLLTFAASTRRRARRKELRTSQHDLEDRIAELERENADLRGQAVSADSADARSVPAEAPPPRAHVAPSAARNQPAATSGPPTAVEDRPAAGSPPAPDDQQVGRGATRMERLHDDEPADDRTRRI
jgi:hypothetical protein